MPWRPSGRGARSLGVALCLALVCSGFACGGEPSRRAAWPTEEWPVSTPEEQGMDSGALADFVEAVVATSGIEAVVVVRNGYLVVDSVVHPYPVGAPHAIHSVTKSVIGTLIGIAVDRGLLDDVDVPVVEILTDHVPASLDEQAAAITVEDLLTMSTGLECRDSYLYEWQGLVAMMESSDWVAYVLGLPMIGEPGAAFEYCNGASLLLSAVLSEVTGEPASEFAREALFEPLGISEFSWTATPDGMSMGWSGLSLSATDLARIGLLHLRDGAWSGGQLVSEDWVEAATSAQIDAGTLSERYGYQWWVDDSGTSIAIGYGGQYVFVVPDLELVVVFVGSLPVDLNAEPEELFDDHVLAAVVSDDPLPANEDEHRRLSDVIAAARSGPDPVSAPLPDLAKTVDGARYEMEPNEMGLTSLRIRFAEPSATIDFEIAGQAFPLEVGTNGRFVVNEIPGGPPTATRGAWEGDAFVIEYHAIGDVERGIWNLSFDDTGLRAVLTYAGAVVVDVTGERSN